MRALIVLGLLASAPAMAQPAVDRQAECQKVRYYIASFAMSGEAQKVAVAQTMSRDWIALCRPSESEIMTLAHEIEGNRP